ncbi:RNA polymerase sigma-70 factor [Chitinophaga sp.]|uniref:RNA polymerase sigma-70 factor n=1 Tax=Chitinophaga sp. TaxID=1869181 RepID=UPI00261D602C|nr:RNA polymerase sigma-70 factor [uncultured Chitinophaga sp.]
MLNMGYSALSDKELMSLLAVDDARAFETLYQRHAGAMYAYAYRKVPVPAIVEDLLQEVFTNVYRRRAELSHIENIPSYLYNALRNRIFNELRNSLLHERHHQQLSNGQSADLHINYDLRELEKAFAAALDKLTERSREIFLLSRRDHLTYKEIAERLGISVKAVEKHMSRTLGVMREELKDFGVLGAVVIASGTLL